MVKSTFELEKKFTQEGVDFVIGVDEAGRGPLAGPVVACATTIRNNKFSISNFQSNSHDQIFDDKNWDFVRDSKKLSEKQREKTFDFIYENFYVGIGVCDYNTIDRINILEASFLAMKKAISSLMREIQNSPNSPNKILDTVNSQKSKVKNIKAIILVDGNKEIPNLSMKQKAVVGGDKTVKSIAAASIVAKVTRDRMMIDFHEKYPVYGFDKHKGYGTKIHMDSLKRYGPCEIHRKSFGPVKRSLLVEKKA